jgi:glycine/D-amino acid oxidase-like deaminating enzyme/nitrite reductase/ring-hydroxylating ferredoxin subunit
MNVDAERTRSLWTDVEVATDCPALDRNENVDVVVVGSGIAGLSVAYEMSKLGRSVVVLDRGPIGKGMTARTTAHLSSICDDGFDSLTQVSDLEGAKQFYESHSAAINRIETIQAEEQIACDFRRLDAYLFPEKPGDTKATDDEAKAAREVGVVFSETDTLPIPGRPRDRALRYANQATFHPLKYLAGLAAAIQRRNGRFYSETAAMEFEENERHAIVTCRSGFKIHARAAVVATNSPINDMVTIHTKQAPYRTFAMAFEVLRGAIEDALYWDTADPYHYVRLQPGSSSVDYLIVGGADHKTGEADDGPERFNGLEAWTRELFPQAGAATHRWSGQVMEPMDYRAFIGRNPGNQKIYIATGDSGQGMTHGALAGLIISQMIAGGTSPWAEFYEPSRKVTRSLGEFISENLTAVKNYAEYIAPGELSSVDELERGKGAIIRHGLKKLAAYRDDSGKLHLRSAACTHVGCHLHWNSLERCWDCPCHGSQFSTDGRVLNAPAIFPLSEGEV